MQYTKLGSTGLDVSRITVGCMSWGDPARGGHPLGSGYVPPAVAGHV